MVNLEFAFRNLTLNTTHKNKEQKKREDNEQSWPTDLPFCVQSTIWTLAPALFLPSTTRRQPLGPLAPFQCRMQLLPYQCRRNYSLATPPLSSSHALGIVFGQSSSAMSLPKLKFASWPCNK